MPDVYHSVIYVFCTCLEFNELLGKVGKSELSGLGEWQDQPGAIFGGFSFRILIASSGLT